MTHIIEAPKPLPAHLQASLARWASEQGKVLEVRRSAYSVTYRLKAVGK